MNYRNNSYNIDEWKKLKEAVEKDIKYISNSYQNVFCNDNTEIDPTLKEFGENTGDFVFRKMDVDSMNDGEFIMQVGEWAEAFEKMADLLKQLGEENIKGKDGEQIAAVSQVNGVLSSAGYNEICEKLENRNEKIDYQSFLKEQHKKIIDELNSVNKNLE